MTFVREVLACLLLALVVAGCGGGGGDGGSPLPGTAAAPYTYSVPPEVGDGLETASLEDVGMAVSRMTSLIDAVRTQSYVNIHSVVVVRDGKLVLEEYFGGVDSTGEYKSFNRNTLHGMHSVTKSVNSALIGIALGQQLISGVDARIVDLLPQHADLFTDPRKLELTLRDFLTMNAGLVWDEWTYSYNDPRNDHSLMNAADSPIRYVLARPLGGPDFVYNSGVSISLGGIIESVSSLKADRFAREYLFRPLGIDSVFWYRYPDGTVQTGGGLWLRPRDMARIGLLFMNGGRWGTEQVVPQWWVEDSMVRQATEDSSSFDYGYQWWLGNFVVNGQDIPQVNAQGRGGQFIFLVPSLDMVAVFTGWNDDVLFRQPFDMMQRYVLPAAL